MKSIVPIDEFGMIEKDGTPMVSSRYVAEVFKKNAIGVILTGMGSDGTVGLKAIKERGGYTIAEDPSTAVVYGMPRSAKESGMVDKVVPLPLVASTIISNVTK